ncbi:hypothetical protein ACLE0P_000316 [Cronobacter sakazakii]|uniref:hypothetical protein n=1 Tax=Cronobacter sakazakii TaxID=28141 RepID=UPI000CFD763C|nr:hypothetical protein [Cronobacter sakazakii]EKM1385506.1 hypothetical protein [Cronobacter sakazakii]EKM6429266.1 hypothetical protein [Cronobacter sakazakii]ELY7520029.1 hypothetical protein [Cronobacter sakazakii]ELZ1660497.1 hypothetical protein [Cronobacter sakazakii]UWT89240.1 hypothetical protein N1710_09970 [Cronobacter sakazakii]
MLSGHQFLALSGFSLIAAACGLARFSWGLQLPEVIRDIPMSSTRVGVRFGWLLETFNAVSALGIFGLLALLTLCLPAERTENAPPDICSRKPAARR